jgi:hypothetical protein
MPKLIKNISVVIVSELSAKTFLARLLSGKFGEEDYINVPNFIAYTQNFKQVLSLENINKPLRFGQKTIQNQITLEISY